MPAFYKADFLIFRPESVTAGRPTVPDLVPDPDFFHFIQIFYLFPCTAESTALSPGGKLRGGVPGTTMSSAAIISAGLMMLIPLCCRCRRPCCFVAVFAAAVLIALIAVWHHCRCRRRRRRRRPSSPCHRQPCCLRRRPRCHRHNVPRH